MPQQQPSWELGNRRYIREKVISLYEVVFAEGRGAYISPADNVWRELFLLKVNRLWLRQCVLAMPEEQIMGPRKPLFRDIFSRCIAQLKSEDAQVAAHGLEMLGAVLSALGCKSFPDPGSDTLELFCGIQHVEAVMAELLDALCKMLGSGKPELVHAAIAGALSVSCLTPNVNQNILVEFMIGDGLAEDVLGVLYGVNPEIDSPLLREHALKLSVLLSSFHRYESHNPFRIRLQASASAAELSRMLGPSAVLLTSSNIGPADATLATSTAPTTNAASVAGSLYSAFQWGLEILTLDDLVPGGAASGAVSAAVEGACRSELLAAALLAYEVVSGNPRAFGQAFFSLLTSAGSGAALAGRSGGQPPQHRAADRRREQQQAGGPAANGADSGAAGKEGKGNGEAASSSAGGSMSAPSSDRETAHCQTFRCLITLATLGALELKTAGAIVTTRLCLLTLLSAASSSKLLEAAHARTLGGDLPLWRVERGSAVLRRTTRHATLASAMLEVVTLVLSQNLRKNVPSETFHTALLLLHRLMLWQLGSSVRLLDGAWRPLWTAVLLSLLHCGLNRDIPDGDSHSGWLCLCLQHMSVVNLVLIHGSSILPQAALQQQFAYEIVRQHREFERLFKEGKRRDESGRLVAALALVRRIIVMTLNKLDAPSGPSHSQADVMGALRELQLEVDPQMAAALQKWQLPPENPTHVPFFQTVSRQLIASYRSDTTLEFCAAPAT